MQAQTGSRVYREYRWFALILLVLVLGSAVHLMSK
jgi:hypothetical protein